MLELGDGLLALALKDSITKLSGPSVDYFGAGLKNFIENLSDKGKQNLKRIFENAEKKFPTSFSEASRIPPRIIKEIFNEGPFIEDEIQTEYFGGVLATARTGNFRDDRSMAYLNLIKGLSTYDIRTHYLIYSYIRNIFSDSGLKIAEQAHEMKIFIPFSSYAEGMDFLPGEDGPRILVDSLLGLKQKNLIENPSWGSKDFLNKQLHTNCADCDGFIITPTQLGARIYLISHGLQNYENDMILKKINITKIDNIQISNLPKKLT